MENLYDILEVSKKASKEVIEKAYKTLAKKYHPDIQAPEDKAKAEEMMKKINDAYSVLSDDRKRQEYDIKLENEEHKNISNSYNNRTYSQSTNNYSQPIHNINSNPESTSWRDEYLKLSKKEQKKLKKKIEKEANEEYKKMYADYLRSLGYRVKHKWTFKDFLTIILVIVIIIIALLVLWWIPPTHEWMLSMYNENIIVRTIVNAIIGICKSFV